MHLGNIFKFLTCAVSMMAAMSCGDISRPSNLCPDSLLSGRKKLDSSIKQLNQKDNDLKSIGKKFFSDWEDVLKPGKKIEKTKAINIKNDLQIIISGLSSLLDEIKLFSKECDQLVNDNERYIGCKLDGTTSWSASEETNRCTKAEFGINSLEKNKTDFENLAQTIDQNTGE